MMCGGGKHLSCNNQLPSVPRVLVKTLSVYDAGRSLGVLDNYILSYVSIFKDLRMVSMIKLLFYKHPERLELSYVNELSYCTVIMYLDFLEFM